jgi:hypothetical protein
MQEVRGEVWGVGEGVMDSIPLYIQIGAILGIISTFIIIILNIQKLLNLLSSFITRLRYYPNELGRKLSNWWWWRQSQPTWEISEYEDVNIVKVATKADI